MIPIVNDLTVGMAMQQYHHECRRPRGVYLSIDRHLDGIEADIANLGAGHRGHRLDPGHLDAEQILGWAIGAWACIEIRSASWQIYTRGSAGIDPTRVILVMLDVGTNP